MDLFSFIDYCADHGCDGAELTAYFLPPNADRDYFNRLKRHAHLRGVSITGTAIGNNFSQPKGDFLDEQVRQAKQWIDVAAQFNAPHVRFFAGEMHEFAEGRDRVDNAIAALNECADYAGEKGIFIGVENHGGITSDLLVEIIESVDSPWIGINLDTGNFFTNTPYKDLERCAPYAVNVQVKVSMQTPEGEKYPADFDRVVSILESANYQGFVTLEYEDKDPLAHVPEQIERLRAAINHR
ncbi:sugar phosphate isomerase/epimerase family protein [Pelagicoccus sp. SDUM812002]|uniref:sugar phosphate isomerase/epimerase family protein n=1 Tax=Pelagicoccus sp. SDUM812002 TaxID=3041266 RepID=UPI00280FA3ED|nr:sugar phosphate isomerase/epimerase family protein [Pelagicoccus sp. SDUM812002]MDQ8186772.1 sugar phosphate isomerase/epimerase [Pelagicoccus sp. SDUM812002]